MLRFRKSIDDIKWICSSESHFHISVWLMSYRDKSCSSTIISTIGWPHDEYEKVRFDLQDPCCRCSFQFSAALLW